MKKFLPLAILSVFAGVASAASIQWTFSSGAATIKASGSTTALSGGTAYLILASNLADIEGDINGGQSFADIISGYALDSAAITSGKINPTTRTATSDKITAPNAYNFQVLIYDAAADQYYSTTVKNQYAYDPTSADDAAQIPTAITLNATDLGATRGATASSVTWKDGTVTVPEPATGALALAGVALLFKRRRA